MTRACVALLAVMLATAATVPAGQGLPAPLVLVAEFDGVIHPASAEYFTDTIDEADASGAALVVFVLRTPGGLLDSTRTIVSRMITSRAPVAVLVAPSGARAASAGFVILMAADVAAMAPGTHAGAAHPVSGTAQEMDDTASQKAASDTAAYVRSLAEARRHNVSLAAEAVLDSRAFTDQEARAAAPPLIDISARDVDDLLRQLDGRTLTRFDGRTTTLALAGASQRTVAMTWRQRLLGFIAHPQVASLLLMLGLLGLTVELWNPGAILPGVAGGICLLLAFFAFQILPVNATGLLLIVFGMGLLLLELKVPSFGALGIGGVASLVFGSLMVTRNSIPGITVGAAVVVPAALALAAAVFFLGRLALAAQKRPAVTGAEGMIGLEGRARDPIGRDRPGWVDVRGELWRAVSSTAIIAAGDPVRVVTVNGLTLVVEPLNGPGGEPVARP